MNASPHTIIVGGSRGIGRETAELLLERGHTITLMSRTEPAQAINSAQWIQCDASSRESVDLAISQISRPKVTGVALFQRFRGQKNAWAGNLDFTLAATRNVIESIASADGAKNFSVVVMGSSAASRVASEQDASYHAAKAGLLGLVRFFAWKLGHLGIRVNSVSPGTLIKRENRDFFAKEPDLVRKLTSVVPLARLGTAREVAQVVAFLLSDEASFITGQDLTVDGGTQLLHPESFVRNL